MGGETRRVRHRHPGPAQGPLEGATEVTMTGETGTAALGVFDPEPLHRRRVLLRLGARHRRGYARDSVEMFGVLVAVVGGQLLQRLVRSFQGLDDHWSRRDR